MTMVTTRPFSFILNVLFTGYIYYIYRLLLYLRYNTINILGGLWTMKQVSSDQRERMTMSVERLNESSDRITQSRRTILETEELGVSILQDLHQQRETLLHSHQKVCQLFNHVSA